MKTICFPKQKYNTYLIPKVLYPLLLVVVLGVPLTYSRYSEIGADFLQLFGDHCFSTCLSNTYLFPLVLYMLFILVVLGVPLAYSRCSDIGAAPRIQTTISLILKNGCWLLKEHENQLFFFNVFVQHIIIPYVL